MTRSPMTLDKRIAKAEKSLGFEFQDKKLLRVALTHRSFAFEASLKSSEINEKLEFLGDAVLDLTITDFIFRRFPKFAEGDLAKLRANLVNTEVLASVAQSLKLGDFIFLGRGAELTGGRERKSILADCFEAVVGAMYLDQGIEAVRSFILRKFKRMIVKGAKLKELADFKTSLQEYTAQKLGVMPEYVISREEGPVHERVFYAEVSIKGKVYGRGRGTSKKRAEQEAAKKAVQRIKKK